MTRETCARCGAPLALGADAFCLRCLREQGDRYTATGDRQVFSQPSSFLPEGPALRFKELKVGDLFAFADYDYELRRGDPRGAVHPIRRPTLVKVSATTYRPAMSPRHAARRISHPNEPVNRR